MSSTRGDDEGDGVLFQAMRQQGIASAEGAATIAGLDSDQFYEMCAESVLAIDGSAQVARKLSSNPSDRFKVCADLARSIKGIGYARDVGFQQLLYPTTQDVRALLVFLVERFPRRTQTDAAPGGDGASGAGGVGLRRRVHDALVRASQGEPSGGGGAPAVLCGVGCGTALGALPAGDRIAALVGLASRSPAFVLPDAAPRTPALIPPRAAARIEFATFAGISGGSSSGLSASVPAAETPSSNKTEDAETGAEQSQRAHAPSAIDTRKAEVADLNRRLRDLAAAAEVLRREAAEARADADAAAVDARALAAQGAEATEARTLWQQAEALLAQCSGEGEGEGGWEAKAAALRGEAAEAMADAGAAAAAWDAARAQLERAAKGHDAAIVAAEGRLAAAQRRAALAASKTKALEHDLSARMRERAELQARYRTADLSVNRFFYVARIGEIITSVRKQEVEISNIVEDTLQVRSLSPLSPLSPLSLTLCILQRAPKIEVIHTQALTNQATSFWGPFSLIYPFPSHIHMTMQVQRELNSAEEALTRAHRTTDEVIYREAKVKRTADGVAAYELVSAIRAAFGAVTAMLRRGAKMDKEREDMARKTHELSKTPFADKIKRAQRDLRMLKQEIVASREKQAA